MKLETMVSSARIDKNEARAITDEQIVLILRETDQDSVVEVAKRHGVSQPTIYAWRKKFGQLDTYDDRKAALTRFTIEFDCLSDI